MTKNRPELYTSQVIDDLISEISTDDFKKTERKMMLAALIYDALKAKNMKNGDLAKVLNKRPSEISKWLSGTHNFTIDTLFEIEQVLDICLVNTSQKQIEPAIKLIAYVQGESTQDSLKNLIDPFSFVFPKPQFHKKYSYSTPD